MRVVITSSPRLLLRPAAGRHHRTSRAGWSTLHHRRHEIAVDLHQVRMAHSTSPALAAVCRRSRGSVRFHSVLQAVFHKRAQANKKGCYTRKSALGPAPGGLRQPQAGGHLRWATAASYKPEVQSGRGLCQPQARVRSGGLWPMPATSLGFGRGGHNHKPGFRLTARP